MDRLVAPVARERPTLLENVGLADPAQQTGEAGTDGAGKNAAAHRSHVGPLPIGVVDFLAEGQVPDAFQGRSQAGNEERGQKREVQGPSRVRLPRQADQRRGEHRLQPLRVKDAKKIGEQVAHYETDQHGIQFELPFAPHGGSDHGGQCHGRHGSNSSLRARPAVLKPQKPGTTQGHKLNSYHSHHQSGDFGRKKRT